MTTEPVIQTAFIPVRLSVALAVIVSFLVACVVSTEVLEVFNEVKTGALTSGCESTSNTVGHSLSRHSVSPDR